MGSTQRNIHINEQLSRGIEFYNSSSVKVHSENPKSKFINQLSGNTPHKSFKAKKATKKKKRR